MRIQSRFEGGTAEWHDIINSNAAIASEVLTRPSFIEKVRTWPEFFYTTQSPAEIAAAIAAAGDLLITVGFYATKKAKAIAFEGRGKVYFNILKRRWGAGSPGNIAHETMHAMGYRHKGNKRRPNLNTVPYRIGDWVEDIAGVIDKRHRRTV